MYMFGLQKVKQLVSFHFVNRTPFKLSSNTDTKPHSKNTPSFCKSAQSGTHAPESTRNPFDKKKEELEH
jgi:hypothetical protein